VWVWRERRGQRIERGNERIDSKGRKREEKRGEERPVTIG